ncbi:MAG: GGDEF domain-containing protein [Armatimonas sp.]
MDYKRWYTTLQVATIIIAALVCATVFMGAWWRIPWSEVLCFTLLASLLRLRSVPLIKDPDGNPLLSHIPGEAVLIVAILRHGPETAVVLGLLTNLIAIPRLWHEWPRREQRLAGFANAFFLSAAAGVFGFLYENQGGQRVVQRLDCDVVFVHPLLVEVPLLVASFVVYEIVYRLYFAIGLHFGYGLTLRRVLLDPTLGMFRHFENVGALIGLVLWTRWGWGTLPFTALMMEALMLSAREFSRRIDLGGEALTDPLTGLTNARGLHGAIQAQLQRGTPFCLLFLDLDNFKQVNDTFGHAVGDDLLQKTADTLKNAIRSGDEVGRLGGDEFVVVLAGTSPEPAAQAARRLCKKLDTVYAGHDAATRAGVSLSLGIAAYPDDGETVEALLDHADKRMYKDKRARKPEAARAA